MNMSQKDERQKAIEKARLLHDRAKGAGSSEQEVETAMRKFGELMDTFNLTMDEISLAGEECKEVELSYDDGRTFRLGTVAVAIANFCDCVCYRSEKSNGYKKNEDGSIKRGPPRIDRWGNERPGHLLKLKPTYTNHFFGLSSDAETAAFLMDMVRNTCIKMVDEFKKSETYKTYHGSKLSLTKSFVDGFASRIVSRLNQMKREREAELERAREARMEMGELDEAGKAAEVAAHERRKGNSTDLVALKDAKVKDEFKAKHGWTVKYRTSRSGGSSWTGRSAGGSAAEKVNLSRPVGNGGGYRGLLRLGNG
jgi:hypothetical protein